MTDTRNFSLTFTVEQLTALVAEAISEGRRASRIDPDELAVIVVRKALVTPIEQRNVHVLRMGHD